MEEWVRYADSVDAVLLALGQFRMTGDCPTLLCLPDILVLRDEHPTKPANRKGKSKTKEADDDSGESRTIKSRPSYFLDGHACISGLTAAYLCHSLASEYSVLLAVKAGDYGQALLKAVEGEFQRRGSNLFRSLAVKGIDREIETPTNTSQKVNRKIFDMEEGNQLSWADLDSLNCLRWLEPKKIGLLIGDAESYLLTRDKDGRTQSLMKDAAVTIIDMLAWNLDHPRNKKIWRTIVSLVTGGSLTFVSISDSDVRDLAVATALETSASASLERVCQALAGSLRAGFLVLHGKEFNIIFSCPDGNEQARVPICDINAHPANGAGDTFNGALALAAVALLLEKSPAETKTSLTPDTHNHILAFATAVVSLRLQNGRYATRGDLLREAKCLRPRSINRQNRTSPTPDAAKGSVGTDLVSQGQWLAHVLIPFWSDVPKLALIDLDHTLCDSEKWRLASAFAGFRALGISRHPQELESLYEKIYKDHELWEEAIGVNVRYQWNSRQLFELALALDELEKSTTYDTLRGSPQSVKLELARIQRWQGRNNPQKRVDAAVKAFEESPAFSYPDSLAALYQLRDVLGFKLLMVTEGDFNTQCWKLNELGLGAMFPADPDVVYTEDAFASIEQVNRVFSGAMVRHEDEETIQRLRAARRICIDFQKALKASWRAEALRRILERSRDDSRASLGGVHMCTFGDRIDTDVIPYLAIRRQQLKGGIYGGLVIGRLKRGFYKDQDPEGPNDTPDMTVNSLPEFVAALARPSFWHYIRP